MNPEIPGVGSGAAWAIALSVWIFERKGIAKRLYTLMGCQLSQVLPHLAPGFLWEEGE